MRHAVVLVDDINYYFQIQNFSIDRHGPLLTRESPRCARPRANSTRSGKNRRNCPARILLRETKGRFSPNAHSRAYLRAACRLVENRFRIIKYSSLRKNRVSAGRGTITRASEGRRSEGRGLIFSSSPGIKLIKPDYLGGRKKLQYGGRSRATFPAPR